MLKLAGDLHAAADAGQVLALETELAKVQWTKVENRDPVKTYNKVELTGLGRLAPGYPWKALSGCRRRQRQGGLRDRQPAELFHRLRPGAEKDAACRPGRRISNFISCSSYAPYLSKPFVDENFSFNGTVLRGIPQNLPRWKRGVQPCSTARSARLLGKLYVARYFPAEQQGAHGSAGARTCSLPTGKA